MTTRRVTGPGTVCSVPGCLRPVRCKGLCESDYRKAQREPRKTADDLYEAKVDRSGGPGACHPWTGAINGSGYGSFAHDGESLAARWAYKRYVGPLGAREVVRHTCDTPSCQNRTHWVRGTQADNIADTVARNRQHRPRGERNVKARLTEQQVREIRASLGEPSVVLAARYGVDQTTITSILRRETWQHLAA